ncbi:hypothetical protein ACFQH8_18415 [Halomicroarcula sp. GCM10025710]
MLGAAAEIGPPAAESVSAMGKHLSDLQRIEQELRRDLAQVTGTLSNTAALFGPLVGGATVALGKRWGPQGPSAPGARVGLVVGWYVLVLAVVLTALSAGLRGGFDRVRVGHRVGVALMSATATFFTAVFATRLVVEGLYPNTGPGPLCSKRRSIRCSFWVALGGVAVAVLGVVALPRQRRRTRRGPRRPSTK